MTDQEHAENPCPEPDENKTAGTSNIPASAQSPSPSDETPKTLSAEEQMALYEKELKESDWGHQPC